MHMKKEYIGGLFFVILVAMLFSSMNKHPIDELKERYTVLVEAYRKEATDTTLKKINDLEEEIRAHIATNGYEVEVKAAAEQQLAVIDTLDRHKVVAQVINGEHIMIYKQVPDGTFIVLTEEGAVGYLLHDKFNPSLTSFPLKVLVAKTTASSYTASTPDLVELEAEVPLKSTKDLDKTTRGGTKPLFNRQEIKELPAQAPQQELPSMPAPSKECPVVRCTGRTQKGKRCKRNTSSCDKRCHDHQ